MLTMPAQPLAIPDRPILVVDDDAKIVRLVRTYLERDGFMVVTAADGPAALDAIERHRPALVVLDLMLPELDGRAVIRAVRRDDEAAATPILILSARGSTIDRIAGLEDGADDYLPKPFSPAELVLRVKSILRRTGQGGSDRSGQAPLRLADLVIDLDRYEVTRDGIPIALTRVEFKLLATLIEAGGRVLTRDQLLDAVWGQDQADVLDRTVDVHVGRLRDRLGDDADAPRYVVTVRGIGYRAAVP
jgi:two-component system alkaline phosphatase synthesis response regulator PhoP